MSETFIAQAQHIIKGASVLDEEERQGYKPPPLFDVDNISENLLQEAGGAASLGISGNSAFSGKMPPKKQSFLRITGGAIPT